MGKTVGSTECQRLGEGNPSWNCNAGAGAYAQQSGEEKLVRVVEGGKLHSRGGEEKSHT
jgi:hypothetical protein